MLTELKVVTEEDEEGQMENVGNKRAVLLIEYMLKFTWLSKVSTYCRFFSLPVVQNTIYALKWNEAVKW